MAHGAGELELIQLPQLGMYNSVEEWANELIGILGQKMLHLEQLTDQVPPGGILLWNGAVADIPAAFLYCDGTEGTPDLTAHLPSGVHGMMKRD